MAGASSSAEGAPTIVYIDQSASPGGNGSAWNKAFRDLQDAFDTVRSGTFGTQLSSLEFRVAQGTYKPDRSTGDREAYFDVDLGAVSAYTMSLKGSFAGLSGPDPDAQDFVRTRTILSGDLAGNDSTDASTRLDNSHLVLRVAKPYTYTFIDGISVRGAFTDPGEGWTGRNGGARLENGDASFGDCYITSSSFEDNQSISDGGGVWSSWRVIRFDDCTFRRNRSVSGRGGAIAHDPMTTRWFTSFSRSVFEENEAISGGAVFSGGWVDLTNAAVADNSASEFGGAVAADSLRAVGSLFFRNRAPEGMALAVFNGLRMYHCTLTGHSLSDGAIIDGQGELEIDRTVLWNNRTATDRTLIRFSTVGSWSKVSDCFFEGGTSFITLPSGTLQYQNVVDTDPQFVHPWTGGTGDESWRTWNYRLRPGSSAIKKGQNRYTYDIDDLDGYPMKGSGTTKTADLGCYYADSRICFANFTGWDFLVDDADFQIFARAYGQGSGPNADMRADLNRDGLVNDADFSIFAAAYDLLVCP